MPILYFKRKKRNVYSGSYRNETITSEYIFTYVPKIGVYHFFPINKEGKEYLGKILDYKIAPKNTNEVLGNW